MSDEAYKRLVDAICLVLTHEAATKQRERSLLDGRDPAAPEDYLDLEQASHMARKMIEARGYAVWHELNPLSSQQRGQRDAFFAPLKIPPM